MSARARLLGYAAVFFGQVACVTSPTLRPVGPPVGEHVLEAGIGPYAMFGKDGGGAGTAAYASGQVYPNVDVIGQGYAADFFDYRGKNPLLSDVLFGGGLGLRGRYALFDNLIVGAEFFLEYDQRTGGPIDEQLVLLVGGVPVAEEAFEGFWVYTNIRLGIALPLKPDPRGPFFGIQEIPLGVAWEIRPWLLLLGEGGVALPVQGGYGAVAVAFRL